MRQRLVRLHAVRGCVVRVIDKRIVGIQAGGSTAATIGRIFQNNDRLPLRHGNLRSKEAGRHGKSEDNPVHCGTSMNSTVLPASAARSRLSFRGVRVEDVVPTLVTRMICQGVSVPLATARALLRIP